MSIMQKAAALGKKLTLITAAFVLAVSTLTAAVPFMLSSEVAATAGYTYDSVSNNQADWSVDRQEPSGWWSVDSVTGRVLVSIDQRNASTAGAFYQTEGVSTSVPSTATSLKGSVYVAADWNTKTDLRVGLWGVTDPLAWPIIEYANYGGYNGWRVWDTINGGWTQLASIAKTAGTYNLEILINSNDDTFDYFVNDTKVAALPADGIKYFNGLILNSYNAGTGNTTDNYVVDWRNLEAGQTEAPILTNSPVYIKAGEANGLATWSHTGDNLAGFEYREYQTLAQAEADTPYWTVNKTAADRSQVVGQSWATSTTLYYRVVAIDVFGNRSAPTDIGTVIIDKVKPSLAITSPENGSTQASSFTLSGTASDDYSGIQKVEYLVRNLTGFGGSTYGGAVIPKTLAVYDTMSNTWSADVSGLTEGYYKLAVTATDNAGNSRGRNIEVFVDTTGPEGVFTYSNDGAPTFENVTVTLTTNEPVQDIPDWTRISDTEFERLFTTNTTGSVVAYDLYNNESTFNFEVVGIDKSWVGGMNTVSSTTVTPTISGLVAYNVDRTVGIAGVGLDLYIDGVLVNDAIVTDANGEWSAVVTVADNATHEATVYLHDANPETDLALVSLTFVTEVPVIVLPEVLTGGTPNGGLPLTTFGAAVVLGETEAVAQDVKGTSTEEITAQVSAVDNADGTAYGIAWYWWLLILAGLAGIVGAIIAFVRRPSA